MLYVLAVPFDRKQSEGRITNMAAQNPEEKQCHVVIPDKEGMICVLESKSGLKREEDNPPDYLSVIQSKSYHIT